MGLNKAVNNTVVASDFIAALCDWLKDLELVSQPIRGKTESSRDLPSGVFPRLAHAAYIRAEI